MEHAIFRLCEFRCSHELWRPLATYVRPLFISSLSHYRAKTSSPAQHKHKEICSLRTDQLLKRVYKAFEAGVNVRALSRIQSMRVC